ncbi:pilus assembly PilX N-terminal domain-containing protein [Candidatus Peregrinibacteria bacterium]|nr:pilus assembly PilX N-terminal domain-containing protein [Candidatus Peregrinibacteria bacterium]
MTNSHIENRKGTALIVALLVTGVLMAISLALSALVLRESTVTREFLDAGQSYYAAESASEIGLYGVKNSLPGWEPSTDGKPINIKIDGDENGDNFNPASVAQLKVLNKCQAYPCLDDSYDKNSADLGAFYAPLGLNESITVPLFVISDKGAPTPITDFDVEFYAGFEPSDLNVKGKDTINVVDWDVLRWKIVGLNDSIQGKVPLTESISDFTAVSATTNGRFTDPAAPSWFGTSPCADAKGRYTDAIGCANYVSISSENCSQMEAREFYLYNNSADGGRNIGEVRHCWPLSRFIHDHKLNYLTLTNLINPVVFAAGSSMNDAKTKLYYRVELFTADQTGGEKTAANAVREFADITADGYSGKSKQSVNVKIKRDSFMPVFNFSLYSTYITNVADENGVVHDEKYWYGENANKNDQSL